MRKRLSSLVRPRGAALKDLFQLEVRRSSTELSLTCRRSSLSCQLSSDSQLTQRAAHEGIRYRRFWHNQAKSASNPLKGSRPGPSRPETREPLRKLLAVHGDISPASPAQLTAGLRRVLSSLTKLTAWLSEKGNFSTYREAASRPRAGRALLVPAGRLLVPAAQRSLGVLRGSCQFSWTMDGMSKPNHSASPGISRSRAVCQELQGVLPGLLPAGLQGAIA